MNTKRHALWAAVAAASIAVVACGGSDDDTASPAPIPSPSPSPAPSPAPSPSPAPGQYFIQPLDTAARSAAVKAITEPVSRLPAGAPVARVALGPLAVVKAAAPADKSVARQIGFGRDVSATASADDVARALTWSTLADGTQVAAVSFDAAGARGLRLGVRVDSIPAGAVLRFHGAGGPVGEVTAEEAMATRARNEQAGVTGDAARMLWGRSVAGEVATLEVQLPAGASPAALRLAVPQLSHLTQLVTEAALAMDGMAGDVAKGDSGSCNLDVMCSAYQSEGRAVAAMEYTKGGGTYLCSGTLMNDTRNSQTPYFLTAAHCIADQQSASTLDTAWFYRASACNSTQLNSGAKLLEGGATLLYANRALDHALLRLNRQPPAGVLFAGSYFGSLASGSDVLGVHHPHGDWQKWSLGKTSGWGTCTFDGDNFGCTQASEANGPHIRVNWSRGVTEGGSSGSAMFVQSNNVRYVAGALSGGAASCENPTGADYYGRYERAFADGINRYLKP